MLDLHHLFTMQKKALFFLLALCALGWGFTPYTSVFAGAAVGLCLGTYNFWILVRRMNKFDRAISEGKRIGSLGTALRFGSGVAVAVIVLTWPQHFNLISAVIGLMIPYVFLFIEAFVYSVKEK